MMRLNLSTLMYIVAAFAFLFAVIAWGGGVAVLMILGSTLTVMPAVLFGTWAKVRDRSRRGMETDLNAGLRISAKLYLFCMVLITLIMIFLIASRMTHV